MRREAHVCRYCATELEPLPDDHNKKRLIAVGVLSAAAAAVASGMISYMTFRTASSATTPLIRTPQPLVSIAQPIAPAFPVMATGETLKWAAGTSPDTVTRQAGPYVIEITKKSATDLVAPIVKVTAGTQSVTMTGEMNSPDLPHSITIVNNRANAVPVVMLQSFTGGAHCCNHVQLAGLSSGTLKVVDVGQFDGDADLTPKDESGDGLADFEVRDERFLYAFAPYAYSLAPPRIFNVVNGKVVDVSHNPHFRRLFAAQMTSAGESCQPGTGDAANGACPAFVADAAMVGKLNEAWAQMVAAYDPSVDWTLPTGCLVPSKHGCPAGLDVNYKSYPEALRGFLIHAGYISPDWRPPEELRAPPAAPASE